MTFPNGNDKDISKTLSPDSPLAKTSVVGTTSAKLSYLLNKVMELHKKEKIIIFYDSANSAFWIAEGLDVLGIDFRIYAGTLRPEQKTAYLSIFLESEKVRVLLMDLRQASHGLHLANASRVFIVNPIWQANVESQAIKRAHRIGQARPVFVETLVLKDTLEDKILKRRKEMTNSEKQDAERDLLDDNIMKTIIQNESYIPMSKVKSKSMKMSMSDGDHQDDDDDEEEKSTGSALLTEPVSLFHHNFHHESSDSSPINSPSHPSDKQSTLKPKPKPKKSARLLLSDDDNSDNDITTNQEHNDYTNNKTQTQMEIQSPHTYTMDYTKPREDELHQQRKSEIWKWNNHASHEYEYESESESDLRKRKYEMTEMETSVTAKIKRRVTKGVRIAG